MLSSSHSKHSLDLFYTDRIPKVPSVQAKAIQQVYS